MNVIMGKDAKILLGTIIAVGVVVVGIIGVAVKPVVQEKIVPQYVYVTPSASPSAVLSVTPKARALPFVTKPVVSIVPTKK